MYRAKCQETFPEGKGEGTSSTLPRHLQKGKDRRENEIPR